MLTRRTALATGLAALAAPARGATGYDDYRAALAQSWGGPIDPLSAHLQAQASAKAASDRADVLLRRKGLTQGTVGERLRALSADARYLYPDDEAGRERAVAAMNTRLRRLRPQLAAAFGSLPIPPAEVRRMTPTDAAAGRAGFRQAPKDGQPGLYYVDLQHIRARPIWSLPSVAFHEVTPGHLLQIPLQPPGRDAGAFFEGWATYAEQLAADLGAYHDDPLGEIGYLQWRLFRVGRVVADAGLAMGWSRDQAIETLAGYQGTSVAFITIEADVDRMLKTPGKVAAEGYGAIKLGQWRPRARSGWPAYHRLLLAEGPWRFGELEKRVG